MTHVLSFSRSSDAESSQERTKAKLRRVFEDIGSKDELRHAIQDAIVYLKGMLREMEPSLRLLDDPANVIANSLQPPSFLTTHPTEKGAFSLPFPSSLASQRTYRRRWEVLPFDVANISCSKQSPHKLLDMLNGIFDTYFKLTPPIENCLMEFINDACDLGQVYGYLRPWLQHRSSKLEFPDFINIKRRDSQQDHELRSGAIVGNHIIEPKLPPRRVWDLYSNRVLPFWALGPKVFHKLRPVSHSWVAPSERQYVLTTINGKGWRVPIPCGTSLNAIRAELLALGAEYVWLDVLCLRQEDPLLPEMESVRKKEWKLDIPTIGHIYNIHRYKTIVTYFNGLGLPFRDGPVSSDDRYHWLNRAWTLQECAWYIVPGGIQHTIDSATSLDVQKLVLFSDSETTWTQPWADRDFIRDLRARGTTLKDKTLGDYVRHIQSRFCSNPIDEVACLAYLMRCHELPIYDADMDVEMAWSMLVECLSDASRTELLFTDFASASLSGSWRPSWKQLGECTQFAVIDMDTYNPKNMLHHVDHDSSPNLGYRNGLDMYYHKAYVIEGCRFTWPNRKNLSLGVVNVTLADNSSATFAATFEQPRPPISDHTDYILITIPSVNRWIIARAEGTRRIHNERVVAVSKLSVASIPALKAPAPDWQRSLKHPKVVRRFVTYI